MTLAAAEGDVTAAIGYRCRELARKPRLAHTGLTLDNGQHTGMVQLHPLPGAKQRTQRLRPSHQRSDLGPEESWGPGRRPGSGDARPGAVRAAPAPGTPPRASGRVRAPGPRRRGAGTRRGRR